MTLLIKKIKNQLLKMNYTHQKVNKITHIILKVELKRIVVTAGKVAV